MCVEGVQQQWWRVDPAVIKELALQPWHGVHTQPKPTHVDRSSWLNSDSEYVQ